MRLAGITECRFGGLWGIPGPGSGPCVSPKGARGAVSEGVRRGREGRALNMEMALIYPRPKVDYNVSTLAGRGRVWENGDQVKGGNYLSEKIAPLLFYCSPVVAAGLFFLSLLFLPFDAMSCCAEKEPNGGLGDGGFCSVARGASVWWGWDEVGLVGQGWAPSDSRRLDAS